MSSAAPAPHHEHHHHHHGVVHYRLDDEPQTTHERVLTARQIMTRAKPVPIDPENHYLIQLLGEGDCAKQISYENKPDEPIEMHDHMRFIAECIGPTPVS